MDLDQSSKPPSPLPAIIVTSLVLGLLAYLMMAVTDITGQASFVQFSAALAALAYLLTLINIRFGMGILILCIGLSPEVGVGDFNNLRFEDFVVPALLVAWLLRTLRNREELASNPFKAPMLAYLGVMIVSALLGVSSGSVEWTRSGLLLGKNLIYVLLFLIVLNNVRTYAEFRAFVIFTLLVSLAAATISLGQSRVLEDPSTQRLHGPLGETANIFGGYVILHISMFLGFFLQFTSLRARIVSVICAGVLFYILMFTYSRTSYIALLCGIGLIALLKHRRLVVVLVIMAILFPLLAPDNVIARAQTILGIFSGPGPESWEARVSSWEESQSRILSRPAFGSGPGSISFGDVDNEYVRVAVDLGLIGLAALLWFLFRIAVRMYRLYAQIETPGFVKAFVAGYFILLVSISVHAGGATSFSAIRTMEAFMVWTGFLAVLINRYPEWKEEDAHAAALEAGVHSSAAIKH